MVRTRSTFRTKHEKVRTLFLHKSWFKKKTYCYKLLILDVRAAPNTMIYVIIAGSILAATAIFIVVIFVCCRRGGVDSPDGKKG